MKATSHSQELVIRNATPDDCAGILALIKELAAYERLTHEVTATTELLHKHLFSQHPHAEIAIAELKGISIGYALFFHSFSTFLGKPGIFLEDIYVSPDYRGRGFGKSLLAFVAKLGIDRECGRLEWSVLDWNTPAVEFYRSLGAVPLDTWTTQRLTGAALEELAALKR